MLIPVQINGRFTCQIEVPDGADRLIIEQAAREATKDKVPQPTKVIVVGTKIVNIVAPQYGAPQTIKPRPCE